MKTTHGYVARCRECNGWVMLVADDPDNAGEVAECVAGAITDGFPVQRMTIEEGRQIPCCDPGCARRKPKELSLFEDVR